MHDTPFEHSWKCWKRFHVICILSPPLISPLRAIINQTLNTGINSDKLKIAKVIPLFKKDDKAKTANHRSISLLALNLENIRESCIQPVVQIFYTKQFVL